MKKDNEIIELLKDIQERQKQHTMLITIGLKDVLNIDEVCMLTNFSKSHIYRLTCYRQIPHYKREGSNLIFFKKKEVEEWLCSHKVKTQDEIKRDAAEYDLRNKIKKGGY